MISTTRPSFFPQGSGLPAGPGGRVREVEDTTAHICLVAESIRLFPSATSSIQPLSVIEARSGLSICSLLVLFLNFSRSQAGRKMAFYWAPSVSPTFCKALGPIPWHMASALSRNFWTHWHNFSVCLLSSWGIIDTILFWFSSFLSESTKLWVKA